MTKMTKMHRVILKRSERTRTSLAAKVRLKPIDRSARDRCNRRCFGVTVTCPVECRVPAQVVKQGCFSIVVPVGAVGVPVECRFGRTNRHSTGAKRSMHYLRTISQFLPNKVTYTQGNLNGMYQEIVRRSFSAGRVPVKCRFDTANRHSILTEFR